jgi:uncharacterized protein YaaR (DUF327 family)
MNVDTDEFFKEILVSKFQGKITDQLKEYFDQIIDQCLTKIMNYKNSENFGYYKWSIKKNLYNEPFFSKWISYETSKKIDNDPYSYYVEIIKRLMMETFMVNIEDLKKAFIIEIQKERKTKILKLNSL